VVGSGFTTFRYRGQPIAFMESVQDSGVVAGDVPGGGQPFEWIHPLGERHPIEIATSRVLGGGTLVCAIKELWNTAVWEQLAGLAGTSNIVEIYDRLAVDPQAVTCQTIIRPPGNARPRGKTYHNCVVAAIQDGEVITVGALSVTKSITIAYTHATPL
jgi:hypothetical protein